MIQVDRTSVPMPPDLSDDDTNAASRERKRTAAFFDIPGNTTKPYDKYKAYKLPAVVRALNDLFHAKCAYCESDIGATQPTDVEHFRPKGGYIARDKVSKQDVFQRPGYHWLAARWENLVPSCIDCNRERTQEFPDGRFGKVGKANKFPLASERTRATKAGDEKREKPLLLNPCSDEPEKHLEFTEGGIIRPTLDERNKENRKGKISIEVYGLARKGLVRRRSERAMEVMASIKRLKLLETELNTQPGNANLQQMLLDEMSTLKRYMQGHQQYAGMSRQLVRRRYGCIPA
jgi:uncharacterized protein (TIGR02646 family)